MPMFDDPSKELEKLQAQLLEQEDWFERELDSAKRMIGDMPAPKAAPAKANTQNGAPVRNDANGENQDQPRIRELKLSEDDPQPKAKSKKKKAKEKSNRGLIILALLETLGILGLVGYWVLVLL